MRRLDELVAAAAARIPDVLPVGASAAEIMWMTDPEVRERHALVAGLPPQRAEAESARRRIAAKHCVNRDA